MSAEFRPARRGNVSLLILLAGGTGAGKTESALRLATGLAAGKPIAVIDTENGRALHKADDYRFDHATLDEPFSPERYADAIRTADEAGYPVIVIDSGSHEYDGIGGVLDIQHDEFARMGERESARFSSWVEPKRRHKLYVRELLRTRAHVIVCHRAEDKIEIVKDDRGQTIVRPKRSLVGTAGWIPICERRLPFEATLSLMLTAERPGVPEPVKIERRHRDLIPLDTELSEETGRALAEWADGVPKPPGTPGTPSACPARAGEGGACATEADIREILELAARLGPEAHDTTVDAIAAHRAKPLKGKPDGTVSTAWLAKLRARLEAKIDGERPAGSQFRIPAGAERAR